MKIAIFYGILFCSAAIADNTRVPTFKAVCNEEVTSGLRPTPEGWRPTQFKSNTTYLIEKKNGECDNAYKKLSADEKDRAMSHGCYLIQDLSPKSEFPVYPILCKEWGVNLGDPKFRIACGNITFNPTKGYIRHHIHQGIEASDAVGNDIFVAAGNCRIIK